MPRLKGKILDLLSQKPELSDREITNVILREKGTQQRINQTCRSFEGQGIKLRESKEKMAILVIILLK